MIRIRNLTKYYKTKIGRQYVFDSLSSDIPTDRNLALLGSNGAGKSTFFRLLAASEYPNVGKIITKKSLSWPVSLTAGVHPSMTGRENARFIARINGLIEIDDFVRRVKQKSGLGKKFDLPVSTYSSGMRSRLSFTCCTEIDFDIYLIDEALSVGDMNFRIQAKQKMLDLASTSTVIMVSHDVDELREFCDSALLLNSGQLKYYEDIEEALKVYNS